MKVQKTQEWTTPLGILRLRKNFQTFFLQTSNWDEKTISKKSFFFWRNWKFRKTMLVFDTHVQFHRSRFFFLGTCSKIKAFKTKREKNLCVNNREFKMYPPIGKFTFTVNSNENLWRYVYICQKIVVTRFFMSRWYRN